MDLIKTSGFMQPILRNRHQVFDQEKMSEFEACHTNETRYEFVQKQLDALQTQLVIAREWAGAKDLVKALEVKKRGNTAFQNAQWLDALRLYNQSYCQVPDSNRKLMQFSPK